MKTINTGLECQVCKEPIVVKREEGLLGGVVTVAVHMQGVLFHLWENRQGLFCIECQKGLTNEN